MTDRLEEKAEDLAGELALRVEGVDYADADACGEAHDIIAAALREVVREAADVSGKHHARIRRDILEHFGLS